MKKNFSIKDAVYINYENHLYDLHNCYDLNEIKVGLLDKSVSLLFSVNSHIQDSLNAKARVIRLEFVKIEFLQFSDALTTNLPIHLEEMGYKNPGDNDTDWLVNEKNSSSYDHIFFRFSNDEYIRLFSKDVQFSVLKTPSLSIVHSE